MASNHQANSSVPNKVSFDSSDQGSSQRRMAVTIRPGRATKKENRLMRRSYSRRTRLGGFRAGCDFPGELKTIFFHPAVERASTQSKSFRSVAHVSLRAL